MDELLQYGLSSSSKPYSVIPNEVSPPILSFVSGLNALYDKVLNVLSQEKGSLFYDRNLGTEIDQAVFESDSETIKEQLRTQIIQDLSSNIHDITISDVQIQSQQSEQGIIYQIVIVVKYEQQEYELKLNLSRSGITVRS